MNHGGIIFFKAAGTGDRAFLNQIEQIKALALHRVGQIDDETQVSDHHLVAWPLVGRWRMWRRLQVGVQAAVLCHRKAWQRSVRPPCSAAFRPRVVPEPG